MGFLFAIAFITVIGFGVGHVQVNTRIETKNADKVWTIQLEKPTEVTAFSGPIRPRIILRGNNVIWRSNLELDLQYDAQTPSRIITRDAKKIWSLSIERPDFLPTPKLNPTVKPNLSIDNQSSQGEYEQQPESKPAPVPVTQIVVTPTPLPSPNVPVTPTPSQTQPNSPTNGNEGVASEIIAAAILAVATIIAAIISIVWTRRAQ